VHVPGRSCQTPIIRKKCVLSRMDVLDWLLALQGKDGQWAGGACFPGRSFHQWDKNDGQPWISTLPTLQLLHDFGVDPRSERVCCRWEHA
jgi:hypothetical protein